MTSLPFLSMLEATAKTCAKRFSRPDRCNPATKGTLATGLYEKALNAQGVHCLVPDEGEQDVLMHLIYDVVKASSRLNRSRVHGRRFWTDFARAARTILSSAARNCLLSPILCRSPGHSLTRRQNLRRQLSASAATKSRANEPANRQQASHRTGSMGSLFLLCISTILQRERMVYVAGKRFPLKNAVFQRQIAACGAVFGMETEPGFK